jgi:ParB-like chromosome segregation protein Spo0J
MKIEQIEIDKIFPYINNPRKNLNADKVASSIKEFGFQQPIVVDKNMSIIVGHTRYEAAKLLELKTVPVHIANLTSLKAKAYRIADNRLGEDSGWDFPLLNLEFTDLMDNHFDVENLGFDTKELESLIVDKNSFLPEDISEQGDIDKNTKEICESCGQELSK